MSSAVMEGVPRSSRIRTSRSMWACLTLIPSELCLLESAIGWFMSRVAVSAVSRWIFLPSLDFQITANGCIRSRLPSYLTPSSSWISSTSRANIQNPRSAL